MHLDLENSPLAATPDQLEASIKLIEQFIRDSGVLNDRHGGVDTFTDVHGLLPVISNWLVAAAKRLMRLAEQAGQDDDDDQNDSDNDDDDDDDDILQRIDNLTERVARALANLSGQTARGAVESSMYLPHSNIEIKLRDASFAEADLGAMTWGASRLFAKMMDNPPDELVPYLEACRDKDILELGTGTGLAGISLAACLSQRQQSPQSITLTDYHDGVLQNAKMNVAANIDESVQQRVRLAKLDWKRLVGSDAAAVTDESTNSVFPELDGDSKFDVIIGADVVYSLEMATLVPRVINHHLASRHSSGNLCPFALIILPKRDRHDADIDSFEQTMLQVGFICELMLELTVDGELASNEHREEGTLLYRCYIYKHNIKQT